MLLFIAEKKQEFFPFCRNKLRKGERKMKNKKPKMINQLHLIYPLIIAGVSMVSLTAFYFGGSSKAGEMVSFASTLSSIILSVIAIIMTIVDVAGQRNTVIDLKETADQLEENITKVNYGIQEINNLKDELLNSMGSVVNSNSKILDQIIELNQKYGEDSLEEGSEISGKYKDLLEDLEKLSGEIKNVNMLQNYSKASILPSSIRMNNNQSNISFRVFGVIKENKAETQDLHMWIRNLGRDIKKIYVKPIIGISDIVINGENFHFNMAFSKLNSSNEVMEIMNVIESIDGEKFKIINVFPIE